VTTSLPHCKTLQLEQQGPHLHVTLNRPESRNALTEEMVRELLAVIGAIADERDIRSVVLRGTGGARENGRCVQPAVMVFVFRCVRILWMTAAV